jgi:DHA2 family multidrug resistance protein-like MFS transporter
VAAPLAGRLADRYPAGSLGSLGLLAMATGLLLLALFPAHGSSAALIWRMALCGLGFGFFQSPNNRTLLSSAPYARTGAAGGMLATARLLGQTLGAASVAILFRAYPGRGSNLALSVAAAIALAAALVSASRLAGRADYGQ